MIADAATTWTADIGRWQTLAGFVESLSSVQCGSAGGLVASMLSVHTGVGGFASKWLHVLESMRAIRKQAIPFLIKLLKII